MSPQSLTEAGDGATQRTQPDANSDFRALTHADKRHSQIVLVDWMLGNHCNFACDYCPKGLHDGSIPWVLLAAVTSFLDALEAHYVQGLGRTVWLQLTGGEPTQYPHFFELCAAAQERGIKVAVISNGSRTGRFWQRAATVLSSAILTYHDTQVDHARFVQTLDVLGANGVPVHINVTAYPDRFDSIVERMRDILAKAPHATLTLKPLRLNFGDQLYPYTEAQRGVLAQRPTRRVLASATTELVFQRGMMERQRTDGTVEQWRANDLILAGLNRWRGVRCAAGLESLRVKADGSVHRAVCGAGGKLGDLGGTIHFPVVPITCDRDSCACVSDILITKSLSKRGMMA